LDHRLPHAARRHLLPRPRPRILRPSQPGQSRSQARKPHPKPRLSSRNQGCRMTTRIQFLGSNCVVGSDGSRLPCSIIAEHNVEGCDHFSHDGHDDDLGFYDPLVRFWVMGANEWRSASDWPPPEPQWIKFYLRGWEPLTTEAFTPSSADDYQAPDAFAQMPASQTTRIQKLRYLSEPLPEDVTIAGPSVLHLYASI